MQAPATSKRLVGWVGRRYRGAALIETALVVPIVLTLAFGVIGVGRVLQAQMGVSAVSREAARAGALANNASEASARALSRGNDVANGYQLTNGSLQLTVDPGNFARGGQVSAASSYTVQLSDLPLMHWTTVQLKSQHSEAIDAYRSRWPSGTSQ